MPGRRRSPARSTLVVGEALIDVVVTADGSRSEHVGGSPLNVAVGLARLDHPVDLATHIARDAHGATIGAHLSDAGVGLVPGSDAAEDTPVATARLDASGSAEYTFDLTWRMPSLSGRNNHVHTGSIGALLRPGGVDVLAAMDGSRQRATVSYDPNLRPPLVGAPETAAAEVRRRVAVSDVVKASDEDLEWLAGHPLDEDGITEWLRSWCDLGPALAVATLGAKGALAVLPSGRLLRLPGRDVPVADTVGAGDAFMSGLLSALLDAGLLGGADARGRLRRAGTAPLRAALQRGIDVSAFTVTRPGAQLPGRADLGVGAGR